MSSLSWSRFPGKQRNPAAQENRGSERERERARETERKRGGEQKEREREREREGENFMAGEGQTEKKARLCVFWGCGVSVKLQQIASAARPEGVVRIALLEDQSKPALVLLEMLPKYK